MKNIYLILLLFILNIAPEKAFSYSVQYEMTRELKKEPKKANKSTEIKKSTLFLLVGSIFLLGVAVLLILNIFMFSFVTLAILILFAVTALAFFIAALIFSLAKK